MTSDESRSARRQSKEDDGDISSDDAGKYFQGNDSDEEVDSVDV